jgi:hypothetical protein
VGNEKVKRPQKGKIGKFIPRAWLVKAMQHWARECCAIKRTKNIEIKILKEENKTLKQALEFERRTQ